MFSQKKYFHSLHIVTCHFTLLTVYQLFGLIVKSTRPSSTIDTIAVRPARDSLIVTLDQRTLFLVWLRAVLNVCSSVSDCR